MTRFFAALYVSEGWHAHFLRTGSLRSKAKALVIFDRIVTGADHRILLNGESLDDILGEVKA